MEVRGCNKSSFDINVTGHERKGRWGAGITYHLEESNVWFALVKNSFDYFFFFFYFIYLFIYLFMAVLGLRFCARAFSSCGKRGPLFIVVCGPLTIAAFLVAEHRLQTRRLSNCGSRA